MGTSSIVRCRSGSKVDEGAAAYLHWLEQRTGEVERKLRNLEDDLANLRYYCRCVEGLPSRAEWAVIVESLQDMLDGLRDG